MRRIDMREKKVLISAWEYVAGAYAQSWSSGTSG